MKIYVIIPRSPFPLRGKRVSDLHMAVYHGIGDYRTLVEFEPQAGVNEQGERCVITQPPGWRWPAVTNDNREPLHVTRSGRFVPTVFGESIKFMIVAPEVQQALADLPKIAFNSVVFEQLVDLSMPRLGDFSWYEREDLDQYDLSPYNLLRSLPHDPSFEPGVTGYRQLLPALLDDLAPAHNDVETRPVNFGSYAAVMLPKEVHFSPAMFGEYPIILSECFLFREDAFATIAPFLDLDYYAIAVLSI